MLFIVIAAQLWMSFPNPDPNVILNGSWQSCRGDDGEYGERIYDHCILGKCDWSLHMGPFHEFALFTELHEKVGIHDHGAIANLLGPNYRVDASYARGNRNWNIPSLKLWVNIAQAGGSRDECESFVIMVRRQKWQ